MPLTANLAMTQPWLAELEDDLRRIEQEEDDRLYQPSPLEKPVGSLKDALTAT